MTSDTTRRERSARAPSDEEPGRVPDVERAPADNQFRRQLPADEEELRSDEH